MIRLSFTVQGSNISEIQERANETLEKTYDKDKHKVTSLYIAVSPFLKNNLVDVVQWEGEVTVDLEEKIEIDPSQSEEEHILLTKTQLESMEKNARCYGWEVGRGHPIVEKLETSDDNPFMDDNWREKYGLLEDEAKNLETNTAPLNRIGFDEQVLIRKGMNDE